MAAIPTYVAAGTAAHADYAGVTPGLPAGIVAGDALFIFAAVRTTTATVPTPDGWDLVSHEEVTHARIFARTWDGSFAAPTLTPTGGAAGATMSAQMAAFRNLRDIEDDPNYLSNASAQNIAYPTITPTRNNCVVIHAGWKQDDWTSVAPISGGTEIGDIFSTLGNDQGLVWDYTIQTTAANIAAGSFTVTGGASAISYGFAISFPNVPSIAAVQQDVYPPRVAVSVTDLIEGDSVEVYRIVGSTRTLLRGGSDESVGDTSFVVYDAELPFNVPVSYVAVVEGVLEYTTSPVTYTLPGTGVALSDAITGQSANAIIVAWPEKRYDRQASTFKVAGRNIIVSGPLGQFEGEIELYTEMLSSRDSLMDLLETATSGIVQIRDPGGYDADAYVAVLSVGERRHSQDGTDERRRFTLRVAETDPWASELVSASFTLQDIADAYVGQTLSDFSDDFATLLDVATGDFS